MNNDTATKKNKRKRNSKLCDYAYENIRVMYIGTSLLYMHNCFTFIRRHSLWARQFASFASTLSFLLCFILSLVRFIDFFLFCHCSAIHIFECVSFSLHDSNVNMQLCIFELLLCYDEPNVYR